MRSKNKSANSTWESNEMQLLEHHSNIVVGILGPRAKLRVSVLLNTIPEYRVRYITSEHEIADAVANSDLVIGTDLTACEGVLHRKPVIVVGDYGLGGLVTPYTFRSHYDNRFRGRVNGMKDEYFSLERLEGEIKRSTTLTFQELQMMSNQITTFLHNIDF